MRKLLLPAGIFGLVAFGIVGAGFFLFARIALELLVGWIIYLFGTVPRLEVNWGVLAIALVYALAFLTGTRYLPAWRTPSLATENGNAPEPRRSGPARGLTMLGVASLLVVAGIATLGITKQLMWLTTSPEPIRQYSYNYTRYYIMNNLRQTGLAAHSYHDQNKRFPSGGIYDEQGNGRHGWQVFLLPYVDAKAMYDQVDLNLPWHDPKNVPAFQTLVPPYLSPEVKEVRDPAGFALSHFAANVHVFNAGPGLRMPGDFRSGAANTLLMGEAAANFKPWGHPANWRDPGQGILTGPDSFGSPIIPGGAIFIFGDCSTRFISAKVSPEVLKILANPRSSELLPPDWDK